MSAHASIGEITLEPAIIRNPIVVSCQTAMREAIAQMVAAPDPCSRCILVVEAGRLVGVLTDRDVMRLSLAGQALEGVAIAAVMTAPTATLPVSQLSDLNGALKLFRQPGVDYVPVVDEREQVVGLISEASLGRLLLPLQQSLTEQNEYVTALERTIVRLEAENLQLLDYPQRGFAVPGCDWSDRQRVETTLEQSERRFESLAAAAPVGIFRTDTWGNCLYVNECWSEIAGCTAEQAMGSGWTQGVHPEDRKMVASEWSRSVLENRPFRLEYRFQRLDGQMTWVVGQAVAEHDLDGVITGYVGTITDITDHKRIEQALRDSESKHRALISALPDLIMRMSSEGVYLDFFSTKTFSVFGDDDLVGTGIYDGGLPQDLAELRMRYIHRALQTGKLQLYEQQILIDQVLHTEEVRIVACNEEEVLVIVRDISERAQLDLERERAEATLQGLNLELEERVERRTAALRESEERFRRIFEQSPLGIAISNLDGRLNQVNASLIQILSYDRESLLQRSIQTLFKLDEQQHITYYLEQLLEQTLPVLSFEEEMVSGKGEIVWVNVTSALLHNAFGRPSAIIHLIEDITQRKQADRQLQNTLKELSDFKYALDQAAIVAITNAKGVITYVNDQFCDISGYTREELIGQTHGVIHSKYHSQEFFQDLWNEIVKGNVWRGEIQNQTKEGQLYWVDTTIIPFLDELGKPVQYLAIRTDITARKWAELKAKLLKERLQFLLASSPAVIFTCEHSRYYGTTSISENVRTLLGYEPLEFLKDPDFWANHIHPDDVAVVLSGWSTLVEQGQSIHEYRFLHSDGNYRWMRDDMRLIYDLEGHPIEVVGYLADISDRKQMELELQEVTNALQSAMAGISRLDIQGRYQSMNRAYAHPCGYEPEEMIGLDWRQTVYPDDIPSMEAAYQTMLEMGKVETETRGMRKDGSLFYKQITMISAFDRNGIFCGHYCFSKDISDRKAAEEHLKRQLAAIEAAIDGVAILTSDRYTYLNQAHVKLFGYTTPEELVGQCWQVFYSPEEQQRFQQEVFPVLLQQSSWQGEAIATRKDGSTFVEGLSLTLTENGELICVCRDITAQKQVEATLREMNERLVLSNAELARATRMKDEFLANMSHELRTPLNAVLGMAEALQDLIFGTLTERQERAIKTIERSGKHLLDLINDILDLSKIESGKLELQIAPASVSGLCKSTLPFVKQQALKKNIQIKTELPADLPAIAVDERRIRQILINLLNNAVKFTPEGGQVTLSAQVEQLPTGQFLSLAVADTGIGIAPENIGKLFQAFVQIDSRLNRQYAGTGLGLSLVHRLTRLHGGSVTVVSQPGQGSCFTVQLPYAPAVAPLPPLLTESTLLPSGNAEVLIIEDSQVAAEQVARYLSELEMLPVIYAQGEGACEEALKIQPALIILDLQLPGLSGWDVLAQLKAHPQTRTIPVLIISVVDERSRGLAKGAADYLVKPITRDQFRVAMAQLQQTAG